MTAQIPDLLYYNNQEHFVIESAHALGSIAEENRPKFEFTSTFNWSGYSAAWQIDNGWLKLICITADQFFDENDAEPENLLYSIYKAHDCAVTATWFSGTLELAYGKRVGKCGQFISVYDNYRVFDVVAGKVSNLKEYDSHWWCEKNNCDERNASFDSFLKLLREES